MADMKLLPFLLRVPIALGAVLIWAAICLVFAGFLWPALFLKELGTSLWTYASREKWEFCMSHQEGWREVGVPVMMEVFGDISSWLLWGANDD